jgi:energy-coupling factor transporter transmembrane protein EcfT
MKMLRKTIKAIVVIVLLKVVMLILDRYSPESSVFHRQFLFSMQLLVIFWLLLSLILFIFKVGRSWVARFSPVLIAMLVLGIDILFTYWMENPQKIPSFLKKEFRDYYALFERNVIEYEPCSVYDSTYSYKIIPGLAFTFGNIEYKNNYVVNSESLRDDETAMTGPQIICAGNAYTFGVGVDAKESFPGLLAAETGKTVLNTGNASYGTVREMKRVVNADTSFLQYVVIQYSKYDVYENADFLDGRKPKISSETEYKKALRNYRWRKEYFPGKYAISICYAWMKNVINNIRKDKYYMSRDKIKSADYFLRILKSQQLNSNIKFVVTEINDYNDLTSRFLPAVDSMLQQPDFASLKGRVKTISVADVLKPEDYYTVDTHLRLSGHRKVAAKIADYIKQDSVAQSVQQ